MDKEIMLSKNALVQWLEKPADTFTKDDIIRYIVENHIQMVNFMYPSGDGRLKTLNFIINNLAYLETILSLGERVDGSSLFPFISASSSDLYVLPRYRTAFLDPFAPIPTVTMLCSFFDREGRPLDSAPEHTLHKACQEFTRVTGMEFQAMGELEYYVIAPDEGKYPATDQRGYHESAPFAKYNDFRTLCMQYIAQTGGQIKYGHSEVGNFTLDGINYEQNEIEFLPVNAEDAADQLMLAKWVIRNLGYQRGYEVTFAPKITAGKAGSGLHIHMRIVKDDKEGRLPACNDNDVYKPRKKNMMLGPDKRLSEVARRAIAGLMKLAPAITAFGNTNPTSYFRLVPHQEAPTNVCWGDSNRSALVRVPLGWTADRDMSATINPGTPECDIDGSDRQTVEIRSADGSADIYLLIAGLAVALRYGFEMEDALEVADRTYISVNIHNAENATRADQLEQLPVSCAASADALDERRVIFEEAGVFSPGMIDGIIARLRSFDQQEADEAKHEPVKMLGLVHRYLHCG